jgi:hypothetical protein
VSMGNGQEDGEQYESDRFANDVKKVVFPCRPYEQGAILYSMHATSRRYSVILGVLLIELRWGNDDGGVRVQRPKRVRVSCSGRRSTCSGADHLPGAGGRSVLALSP